MGVVRFGAPRELIAMLQTEFGLQDFVETGTFHGETAAWASEIFKRVVTIERSRELFRSASERWRDRSNIRFVNEDSRVAIQAILDRAKSPLLFWLDAHWCAQSSAGEGDECPLLAELKIINGSPIQHFVLVDDARYFAAPPPAPHVAEQWPGLSEVLDVLRSASYPRYIVLFEDVFIAVPSAARGAVVDHCRRKQLLGPVRPPSYFQVGLRMAGHLLHGLTAKLRGPVTR